MQTDKPLVTALINTYNYARFLPFAINSVLNQTYENIEIIVVDDGSTDHTSEVLAQYKDKLRVVRTENGGQGHAFNIGIAEARGELIMMLDADDQWMPRKVERMVEVAANNPRAGMLYHRFINVDPQGNPIGAPQPYPLINGDFRESYLRSAGSYWTPITSVLTLRTEMVRKLPTIMTYAVREGADTVLTDYCMLSTEIVSTPEALTWRLLHGSNLYAVGRDGHIRSQAIKESDVRRVEWRAFAIRTQLGRQGEKFEIDLSRNEWRTINLYWLGRASFLQVVRACLLSPEHSLKFRWGRLKWVMAGKRAQTT